MSGLNFDKLPKSLQTKLQPYMNVSGSVENAVENAVLNGVKFSEEENEILRSRLTGDANFGVMDLYQGPSVKDFALVDTRPKQKHQAKQQKQQKQYAQKKEEPSGWEQLGKAVGWGALITVGSAALGGLLGGIFGSGAGAVPGAIAGAKFGALVSAALGFGGLLSGCDNDAADMYQSQQNTWSMGSLESKLDKLINQGELNYGVLLQILASSLANGQSITSIKSTIQTNFPKLVDSLAENNDLLKDIKSQNGDILDVVLAIAQSTANIENLISRLPDNLYDKFKGDLEKIYTAITTGNATLADIQGTINNLATNIEAILDQVRINGATQEEIRDLLQQIRNGQIADSQKLIFMLRILSHIDWTTSQIKKSLDEMKNDIKTMLGNQAVTNAWLETIAADQKHGNKVIEAIYKLMDHMDKDLHNLSAQNKKYFQQLIALAGQNVDKLEEILKMLEAINSNVVKGSENIVKAIAMLGIAMAHKMNVIIGAINKGNVVIKALLEKILAKMDTMDENNKAGFQAILDALAALAEKADNIDENNKAGFEAVLAALSGIADKIDQVDANNVAKLNIIIQKLQEMGEKIGQGVKVDLSTVEALLKEIKGLNEDQNVKLDTMIDQNNTIIALIEGLRTQIGDLKLQVAGMEVNIGAKLDKLIDKIKDPNCNCNITLILEKLNDIIDILKDPNKPNEGILAPLDDLIS